MKNRVGHSKYHDVTRQEHAIANSDAANQNEDGPNG